MPEPGAAAGADIRAKERRAEERGGQWSEREQRRIRGAQWGGSDGREAAGCQRQGHTRMHKNARNRFFPAAAV